MRVCRDPISEFLWAHCDGGHRPRFSSFLRHPGPEIPGEPFESSWGLPEVPRRWHPQAHYRERLAGTHFFLLPYLYTTNYTIFVLKDETGVDTNILKNITAFIDTIFPFFSLTAAPLSESWWDVEELLLRHSFLPQRGVHPLLRRLRHQAVCSRWTTLLWPAWQLRRTVELASPSPRSIALSLLHPRPDFCITRPSIPLPLQVCWPHCLVLSLYFAHTWTQEHDLAPTVSRLWILLLCMFVSTITVSTLLQFFLCTFPPQLLSFFYMKMYKLIN